MENKTEHSSCMHCPCAGWCGGTHGHHWAHFIIRIAIAIIIFWAGVQFGELKATLHGGYGYRMFDSYGERQNMMYYGSQDGPVMVYGNVQGTVVASKATATTTKK